MLDELLKNICEKLELSSKLNIPSFEEKVLENKAEIETEIAAIMEEVLPLINSNDQITNQPSFRPKTNWFAFETAVMLTTYLLKEKGWDMHYSEANVSEEWGHIPGIQVVIIKNISKKDKYPYY